MVIEFLFDVLTARANWVLLFVVVMVGGKFLIEKVGTRIQQSRN